jgi:hypothetical protein
MVLDRTTRPRCAPALATAALCATLAATHAGHAETPEPTPSAAGAVESPPPPKSVWGHVGIALPLVTIAKHTTSVSDQFTILNPIGIGFKVSRRLAVDFETVVGTPIHPTGTTSLVVDPGLILGFDRLALGLRAAFQVNAQANFGLIPLVNYGLVDLDGAMWFVEGAFPIFYSDHQVALTVVLHTGVGF